MLAAAAVAFSPRLAACFGAAPPVPRVHALCIAACVLGVGLCFLDAPSPEGSAGKKPSALGDTVALVSALGASVYLTQAEALRPHLEPPVFFLAVELQCATCARPRPHHHHHRPLRRHRRHLRRLPHHHHPHPHHPHLLQAALVSDAAAYKAEAIKRFDALDEYVRHGELGRGVSELQQTSEKLMRLARRHEQTLQD